MRKTHAGLVGIAAVLVCLDQLVKLWTHLFLPMGPLWIGYPYGGIGVFQNFLGVQFSIHHVINYGAAWGFFSDFPYLLLAVRGLLILGMLYFTFILNREPTWRVPMTLIIAGAISNVLDIFFYGHVVDMFHFILWGFDYPVFNVADSAVCIGIFWLGLIILFRKPSVRYES